MPKHGMFGRLAGLELAAHSGTAHSGSAEAMEACPTTEQSLRPVTPTVTPQDVKDPWKFK